MKCGFERGKMGDWPGLAQAALSGEKTDSPKACTRFSPRADAFSTGGKWIHIKRFTLFPASKYLKIRGDAQCKESLAIILPYTSPRTANPRFREW